MRPLVERYLNKRISTNRIVVYIVKKVERCAVPSGETSGAMQNDPEEEMSQSRAMHGDARDADAETSPMRLLQPRQQIFLRGIDVRQWWTPQTPPQSEHFGCLGSWKLDKTCCPVLTQSPPRRDLCLPGKSTSGCTTRMCLVSASLREKVFSSTQSAQRTFCLRALWMVSS